MGRFVTLNWSLNWFKIWGCKKQSAKNRVMIKIKDNVNGYIPNPIMSQIIQNDFSLCGALALSFTSTIAFLCMKIKELPKYTNKSTHRKIVAKVGHKADLFANIYNMFSKCTANVLQKHFENYRYSSSKTKIMNL